MCLFPRSWKKPSQKLKATWFKPQSSPLKAASKNSCVASEQSQRHWKQQLKKPKKATCWAVSCQDSDLAEDILDLKDELPRTARPYRAIACENHVSAILQVMGLCEASGQQAPRKKTEHREHWDHLTLNLSFSGSVWDKDQRQAWRIQWLRGIRENGTPNIEAAGHEHFLW